MAILAVGPMSVSAASWASPKPDAVGEKVYNSSLLERVAPVAILVGGLVLAGVVYTLRQKAKHLFPDNSEAHHC